MTLEIIGAGMGRTGTESLREALLHLGFGPCHHMVELRANGELVPSWLSVAQGETADWDALFVGYRSQADWPGAAYWRDLADHFPDAKVILTLRDADSWYASMTKTILPFIKAKGRHAPPHRNDIATFCELIFNRIFDGKINDPDHAKAVYEAHNASVIETIPSDRLLIYPVGSDWVPLCDFLGKPVPDVDFPSGNTTTQFQKRIADNMI
ncbi:sulfotransferase family protein [Parasulfitobacter algicola]|uniref:Sulfotransferase family protein n=1 Tax=Parasulfitobacter algicola TaxID=2614809 RepID=A0ABX2ILI9_9RHOB|nr:sulfotransferase family protein [Sulfitobacter algicola]NSX53719.1 sulfotransferase family protein [Sulfitobacter algicola]